MLKISIFDSINVLNLGVIKPWHTGVIQLKQESSVYPCIITRTLSVVCIKTPSTYRPISLSI